MFPSVHVLERQVRSLRAAEGAGSGLIPGTLTGLKQRLAADPGFRVSLLQYVNQLFSSVQAPLGDECFVLGHDSTSVPYSGDGASPFPPAWAQMLSKLSANGSVSGPLPAVACTASWLRRWTEVWGGVSQRLGADTRVFTALRVGLTQLLDDLGGAAGISGSCRGVLPPHRPASLLLNLLENLTRADGFRDWAASLRLRDLWAAGGDASGSVKSLNLDRVEKSLVTMETALRQLKALPSSARASRESLCSVLGSSPS